MNRNIKKTFFLFTFLIVIVACKQNKNEIPKFEFNQLNGKPFNNKNIIPDKEIVFCYLDPSCYSCKVFLEELNQKISMQKLQKQYIVIFNKKKLTNKGGLIKENNSIVYLYDKDDKFSKIFKLGIFIEFPTFIVYNKNKNFITHKKELILNTL